MTGEERLPEDEGPLGADAPDGAAAPDSAPGGDDDALLAEVIAAAEAAAAGGDGEASELDRAEAQRDEYLDALRRLQAEFDNYRKRTTRQQTELLGRAAESLIERFLPVLDALDLAITHGEDPESTASGLVQALQQINSLGRDVLAKEGLERIDEAGVPFDPTVHDAVAHLPHEEGEAAAGVTVDEVLRAGYQLKGRVLRPAMVRVRG
ncbi:MAG TPA: nucleotide exchange factor GrpE [Acidimicrobiales bacterium]|nr:nucleotide exchange factor GrpE [Acidimicrobiales bacterium]